MVCFKGTTRLISTTFLAKNTIGTFEVSKTLLATKIIWSTSKSTGASHITKHIDGNNEERGFLPSSLTNLFRKGSSNKNFAADSKMAPANSKLVGTLGNDATELTKKDASFFKKNPVFAKLNALFKKKLTKKDVEELQNNRGYSKMRSMLGKDPKVATENNFGRLASRMKTVSDEDANDILYGILELVLLGNLVVPIAAFLISTMKSSN